MKNLMLFALLGALTACSGTQGLFEPGDTPKKDSAIFVAKVDLNPRINDSYGTASDKDKNNLPVNVMVTPGDGTNLHDFDEDVDTMYDGADTNKFFAFEVKAGQPMALRGLEFMTYHKAYWLSNTEHYYYTDIVNPSFAMGTPEAGKVYYIGTFKIDLDEKSFDYDKDDKKYDHDEMLYVKPTSYRLTTEESDAAKKWFAENHKKVDAQVQTLKIEPKDSGLENEYRHVSITTTHY